MKFAIISDVHGNAPALRLVLDDARKHGAEGFLFAGDYCISAPWASEVISIIRSLPGAYVISGNDESHLHIPDGDDGQFEASRWCASTLSDDDKAWLDALPAELSFASEGMTIRMAHSSEAFVGKALHERFRTSLLPYLYPDGMVSRETLLADFRQFGASGAFHDAVQALSPGVYIFGHNHIQTWADFGGRILINPGSCGMPLDCGEFCASYTLMAVEKGQVTVEERRIPYDVEQLIAQVRQTGQYAAARVWSELIFSEWRTCREKVYEFLWRCERYAQSIGDARRPFAKDTWEAAFSLWQETAQAQHPELFAR